jgi:hypothetical protein
LFWTINLLENTLGIISGPLGVVANKYDWPLPRTPSRIEQTWIWRQVGMLGQDQLPVGESVFDLSPKPPQRSSYYSWEWRQVDKIGQDRLPIGDQISDLTSHRYVAKPIEQTIAWRQTIMLGKDVLPENQYSWPLPQTNPWWTNYRDWTWRQVIMLGQDVLPFNQDDWPLPGRPPRLDQTWTLSLQTTTLVPVFATPFNQYSWPLTAAPGRIDETWTWNQTPMLGRDTLPENQYYWPLTPRAKPIDQTWAWNQTPMFGQDQLPIGEQVYDLWIKPSKPIDQTWAWRQTIMLGRDTLPFNQYSWPLPQVSPYWSAYRSWDWRQVTMLGQDQMLVGEQIFDRPVPAPQRAIDLYNWVESVNLALIVTPAVLPKNQYDWPVPRAPQQGALGWTWRQVQMLGLDQRLGPSDWPVTYGPAQFTRDWSWNQTPMLGKDSLPVGEQVFDRTTPAPQRAVDLYNWVQSVNLSLTLAPAVLPKNQYDWPNPRAPQQGAFSWTYRQVQMLGQDRLPKNQYDWPLPGRAPIRPTPTEQVQNLLTRIPTVVLAGASEWPLTPLAAQPDRSFYWNGTLRLPTPVLPINFRRQDYDLPNRGPFQPDRSFIYVSQFTPPVPPVVVGASYFLLQPHYINDVYLQAWTTVTEGREIPVGWVPTLMVDPLNAPAVAAFYAAGPRPGYPGPGYDWQAWQRTTAQRPSAIERSNTYWVESPPGMFKLTGLGAGLPPVGV